MTDKNSQIFQIEADCAIIDLSQFTQKKLQTMESGDPITIIISTASDYYREKKLESGSLR